MSETTDPTLRSFVDVDPDSDFPIQNLPYGVFTPQPGEPPRVGVAIGEYVLDLAVLEERGLFEGTELRGRRPFSQPALNDFMALGPAAWREARAQISRLLRDDIPTLRDNTALRDSALVLASEVELHLPCTIPDFTDFYTSRPHAAAVSRIFRGPDADVPPQFDHLPIAYHGRGSSVVISGTEVRRPLGQRRNADGPEFGPTAKLDFELELGCVVGRGNEIGHPVSIRRVPNLLFGVVLLNDWSARDLQQWEYQPLGPFTGKNFATSISPWIVPFEALQPFACAPPDHVTPPLPYLASNTAYGYDIRVEAHLHPAEHDTGVPISTTTFAHQHWTFAQMAAHHTVAGCNLRTGDLLGSGTISGEEPGTQGCLLELTRDGTSPIDVCGMPRGYLEDHDTVILRAACIGQNYRVGFGECRGTIRPATVTLP